MDAKRIIVDFLKWDCEVNYGTSVGYEAGISKKADEYLLQQTPPAAENKLPDLDKRLLECYSRGFKDELGGLNASAVYLGVFETAYRLGRAHAIIGDDVRRVDYLSEADILDMIYSKHSGETNDTSNMDPIQEENNIVKKQFNLDEVLDFTKTYNVQIVQGADLQYHAYIGNKFYGTSMTPMHALWYGIQSYKTHNKPSSGDKQDTGNLNHQQ